MLDESQRLAPSASRRPSQPPLLLLLVTPVTRVGYIFAFSVAFSCLLLFSFSSESFKFFFIMALAERHAIKMAILQKILSQKNILFGKFSDMLTKEDKSKAWKNIHEFGVSIGYGQGGKDFTYLRDIYWLNARKLTMKKVDNAGKTGTGGGKRAVFTDADNLVLDIIGKDSPTLISLGAEVENEPTTAASGPTPEPLLNTSVTQVPETNPPKQQSVPRRSWRKTAAEKTDPST